jgi:hypothetical protein
MSRPCCERVKGLRAFTRLDRRAEALEPDAMAHARQEHPRVR